VLVKIIDAIARCGRPFYSLEFFPPKDETFTPGFLDAVERLRALNPLFVSVTYGAGGGARNNTLDITARLAQRGFTPMAHLTCVGSSSAGLRAFLDSLSHAGVDNILALRGDAPKDRPFRWEDGEFQYASDLVAFVRREFPEFGIGVAAYPTPHPESVSYAADRQATRDKLAASDFGVTQLFFDPREYFEYVEQMHALGVTKPILPGVLPIQSLESIRRVLSLSGGNIPAKLYLSLEDAHSKGGNEAVKEAGIAFAVRQIRRLLDGGAPGIHLYTLNKADTCLRIAEEVGML
jgi:methylenetetrahydrofolate reductase (NADPH)